MTLLTTIYNKLRALAQNRGTPEMKRALWNKEFAAGSWNHLVDTQNDFVYGVIARYLRGGSILDLGCGVGSTGAELPVDGYRSYTGVDISDVALADARARAERLGRASTNLFIQSDIESYDPPNPLDVILLRECLYYIPKRQVPALLVKLARKLNPEGAILIRLFDRDAYRDYIDIIGASVHIIEQVPDPSSKSVVIVCRG